jgi:hypothetical protein
MESKSQSNVRRLERSFEVALPPPTIEASFAHSFSMQYLGAAAAQVSHPRTDE